MPKPTVLALVTAGGEGSRLELLTERRAEPALPYAGVYRLTDTHGGLRLLPPQLGGPGGDGPALVAEEARVRGGARVAAGGRFGADHPEEAA